MLAFGNKEFRNLQEQVLENMRQIDDIKQAAVVLDEFGIKVIGQIESADDLPDPETYEGEFGDAYAVGTEAPYELYIWTRGDSLGNNAYWFDIGAFPQAGPQGQPGAQGEQGPSGTISFGTITTTTLQPSQSASVTATNVGTASNAVYNLSFAIPQGAQGIPGETGATGATGATGPQGPKGDKGDTGTGYIILGQLDSELDLPDPSTTDRQAAYLVGVSEPYDLYVIIGTYGQLEWFNAGLFTTADANINQFSAGAGLTLSQVNNKITYAVDENGSVAFLQDLTNLSTAIYYEVASTYATKSTVSSFQSDVASAFTSVYASISALSSVYATPSDVDFALSNAQVYADGVGLTQKAYTDTSIADLSSVYATPAQVSSAISALDYASVGALSAATVIPSVYGTNDGTNWTSLTIGSDTYGIGGGSIPSGIYAELSGNNTFTGINIYSGSIYLSNSAYTNTGLVLSCYEDTNVFIGFNNRYNTERAKIYYNADRQYPNLNIINTFGGLTIQTTGRYSSTYALNLVNTNGGAVFQGQHGVKLKAPSGPINFSDSTSSFALSDIALKSEIPEAVSGTNDGTNWTSLTIGSDTYDIPAGGGSAPTNMVTTDTAQAITGTKSFVQPVYFGQNTDCYIRRWSGDAKIRFVGADATNNPQINTLYAANAIEFDNETTGSGWIMDTTAFYNTATTGVHNLGTSAKLFNNLYLNGNITDGTNSVSVVNIANKSSDYETWTFTLSDNTTITKKILVG